jgi:hypothetical protein
MKLVKKAAKKAAKKPVETVGQVAVRLRAEYRKHTPEQREIYGGEPSKGTILGEWARAQCNHMTGEEEAENLAYAMSMINGKTAKPHAGYPDRR